MIARVRGVIAASTPSTVMFQVAASQSTPTGTRPARTTADAQLMIVEANRDANTFTDVDEAAGIVWAVDHGAQIVNLSIGGTQTSQPEQDAIDFTVDQLLESCTLRFAGSYRSMQWSAENLGGGWARMWAAGVGDVIRRRQAWFDRTRSELADALHR